MINFFTGRFDQSWFIKYKLYHFPFWALYYFAWAIAELSFMGAITYLQSDHAFMFLFYIAIPTLTVFANLYYLLPHYLEKGKLTAYSIYLASLIIGSSILLYSCFFLTAFLIGKDVSYFCGFGDNPTNDELFHFYITRTFPSLAGAVLLGLCIKLIKNWAKAQKKQQLLEKEKLETELKFLKYQFNPHFLFNTINSIFFLIHKDPKMASTALAKFSELLRYQLYECNETQIPLSNEITYLENFIALEKLRRSPDFQVSLEGVPQQVGHLGIASFILMTFVENAFKHVSTHKEQPNWIVIKLKVLEQDQLQFEVINSTSNEMNLTTEAVKYSGLGLKNVKRRLDLIYPDQYDLQIKEEATQFSVQLQLSLHQLPSTAPIYTVPELINQ